MKYRPNPGMTPGDVVDALAALAQETRLAIFRLLVEKGPDGLQAGVISERLGVAPSSLSFHLAQLARAGLVTQRRLGRNLFYAANFATMNGLMAYLTENCCAGALSGAPVCRPGDTFRRGDLRDEASARPRRR